jgi:orotidine-5'-phosphate decarboxylase
MVIGATRPDAMEPLLQAFPDGGLLLPGVGAQGGDIDAMIAALINHRGTPVVPISRGILFGDDMSQNGIQQRTLRYHSMLESLSRKYV